MMTVKVSMCELVAFKVMYTPRGPLVAIGALRPNCRMVAELKEFVAPGTLSKLRAPGSRAELAQHMRDYYFPCCFPP